MPKAAAKRFTWKMAVTIVAGFVLFIVLFESTAMATRRVESLLLANEQFFLAASLESAAEGAAAGQALVAPGIRVEGNHYATRERIVQVFAPDLNKSIFRIPLAERRRRLLGIDWIEDASVLRIWPNRLIVKVRERRPVAFAKLPIGVSGQFRYLLIDAQGVLLTAPRQHFDFPVLTGVTEEQEERERRVRVAALLQLVGQLGAAGTGLISEVNASSPQDLRVSAKIDGHSVELWLGDRNYLARLQNFTNHFDEIRRESEGVSVFDLRLDDRIMTVR